MLFAPIWRLTARIGIRFGRGHAGRVSSRPRIPSWQRLGADPWKCLVTLQLQVHDAVFAGRTAVWLHGVRHVDPTDPIEIIVPLRSGRRSRAGLSVRRADLNTSDVVEVRHIRTTGILRAISDLRPRLTGIDMLALLDSALHLKLVDTESIRSFGPLAAPAESPMETRLRWLLLRAGLPRPDVQRDLYDSDGRFVGRADIFYPQSRLVIEYDGASHRDRLVEDDRRQNALVNSGYRVLRFTAQDLFSAPETIVAQVSEAVGVSARRRAAAPR